MLTPPTLVNNMLFYAKSAGHVTRPYQGISLPKSKYPGYEVDYNSAAEEKRAGGGDPLKAVVQSLIS